MINSILEDMEGVSVAITSIGLDGEKIDQVTLMEKPRIFVKSGTTVATAYGTLKEWEASYEILMETGIRTSIGEVVICKVKEHGNALIAGPSIISEMEYVVSLLESQNPEKVFVDGAFFRHGFARISEATVLVIGSNYHQNIDIVVEDAKAIVNKFSIKRPLFDVEFLENRDQICLFNDSQNFQEFNSKSILGMTEKIFSDENKKYRFLYVSNSLPNELIEYMVSNRLKLEGIIVETPMNIQLSDLNMKRLSKLVKNVYTLKPMNLVAVCYNPYSPKGYRFNDQQFKDSLEQSIGMRVFNVRKEECDE